MADEGTPTNPARRRAPLAALVIVLLVAAGLRVYHLGAESVWLDEAFSIEIAGTSLHHIVLETSFDVHPPLYYFTLHYWRLLAGDTEAGARLLSVVLSLAGIVAAYAVARRCFDERTALATAALLGLSRFQVEYAQEARMYMLLALACTVSTYAFIEILRRVRVTWLVVYIAAQTVMVYTHIYSVFLVAAHAGTLAWLFFIDWPRWRRVVIPWLAAETLVLVAFTPWLPILQQQVSNVESAFWIPEHSWIWLLDPLLVFSGSTSLLVVLAPLAVWGAIRLWRDPAPEGDVPARIILLPWILGPIVLPFLVSRLGSAIFEAKYTIAASVPFMIITARGLTALPRAIWRGVSWAAIVVLTTMALDTYFTVPHKEGWRDAIAGLEASAKPTDLVLLHQPFNKWPFEYYWRRTDIATRPFPSAGASPKPGVLASVARREVGDRQRVWLVTTWSDPDAGAIVQALGQTLHQVEFRQSSGVEIYLFERTN